MPSKSQLISALQAAQNETLQMAQSLSESDRNESGSAEQWAPRDYLAHIGMSRRFLADDLAAARRGETPPQGDQPDRSNPAVYAVYSHKPWADIQSLLEESHQELIDQLQAFTDEEINDPDHFAWMGGAPIWRRVAGTCFIHTTVHLAQTYLEHGDAESARRVAKLEQEQGLALDSSDRWLGMVHYNQGCYHALLGEKEHALRELEHGFRLSSQFVEFARQDTDLASLHNDPDYLEMEKRMAPQS